MAPQEEKESGPAEEAQSEPAVVTLLKGIDDEYLQLKRACDLEVREVLRRYTEKQMPLLEKRAEVLAKLEGAEAPETGTPALRGFWHQALSNHPAVRMHLEEWDEPVLEYLSDITKTLRDPQDDQKGFRLEFQFAENPYFENRVLWKEYISSEHSPYTGAIDISEIKSCDISWKPGKDVTVELVQKKKKKGGGAKKAAKAKATVEPRSSFFRMFFRSLKENMPLPADVDAELDDDDDDIRKGIIDQLMEQDHDVGCAMRDSLVPFAVRWYTGEATPDGLDDDDDSDEDEDDEEEEEEENEDDDEEEEDNEATERAEGNATAGKKSAKGTASDAEKPKPKSKPAKAAAAAGGTAPSAGGEPNKEDCKQQ